MKKKNSKYLTSISSVRLVTFRVSVHIMPLTCNWYLKYEINAGLSVFILLCVPSCKAAIGTTNYPSPQISLYFTRLEEEDKIKKNIHMELNMFGCYPSLSKTLWLCCINHQGDYSKLLYYTKTSLEKLNIAHLKSIGKPI